MYFNNATKTHPIVFHAPGRTRASSRFVKISDDACKPGADWDAVKEVAVVTWSNSSSETLIEKCFAAHNAPLTVLRPPEGTSWRNEDKPKLLLEWLRENKEPNWVIGLDAFDVVLTESPLEILRRYYENFGTWDMVFNASTRHWPRGCKELEHIHIDECRREGHSRFLNAGAFIAQRDFLEDRFVPCVIDCRKSLDEVGVLKGYEQPAVKMAAYDYRYNVTVDTDSIIFQHMRAGRREIQDVDAA